MYLRLGLLGLHITTTITIGRDTDETSDHYDGILGGSTHNFERSTTETIYEYEEEPEDAFGFH